MHLGMKDGKMRLFFTRVIAITLTVAILFPVAATAHSASPQEMRDITYAFECEIFLAEIRRILEKGEDDPIYNVDVQDIRHLNVEDMDIKSLAGIEYFTALWGLGAWNNRITTLDVSNNQDLWLLFIAGNQLESLDLSGNPHLGRLWADNNRLTELDVSNNAYLLDIYVANNYLVTLDVTNNLHLETLDVRGNNMNSPDEIVGRFMTRLFLREERIDAIYGTERGLWFWPQRTTPTPLDLVPEMPPPDWGWIIDVHESDWFYDYVPMLLNLFGTPERGMFKPHASMSRAQFEQLMSILEDIHLEELPEYDLSLAEQTITREEMVARLYDFANENGLYFSDFLFIPNHIGVPPERKIIDHPDYGELVVTITADRFTDEDIISYWAVDAVRAMHVVGVVRGRADGRFDPHAVATRAEGAAIMARFLFLAIFAQPREHNIPPPPPQYGNE